MPGLLRKVGSGARIHRAGEASAIGLRSLFMFDEDSGRLRDLVTGTNGALTSGTVSRGEAGRILTFNGTSQATALVTPLPDPGVGTTSIANRRAGFTVLARFRIGAAAGTNPAGMFGIYSSSSQGGFGVGWSTTSTVGAQELSGSGAGMGANSAGTTGNWYTVAAYSPINSGALSYAWINGIPATTNQGSSTPLNGGASGLLNEISVGGQHRSSGFLRYANGDLEWGAVLFGYAMSDALAFRLYADDFPYNLLTPRRRYYLVPAAGGTDATASGVTIAATASLVAGTATADSTAAGATLTATASLIPGAATASSTAAGATITATAALVAGAATADSTAAGATLTATASLIPGAAAADSTAPGATVAATASLVAGAATADSAAAGATLAATASLVAGAASADSTAAGTTLTATASLVPGAASGTGDATAAGATVTATASLIAGAATADSTASGATLAATASLVAGAASADSTAAGVTLTATASLIPGAATGAGNATAAGATITATASLIAGAASADSTAPGTTRTVTLTLVPGGAFSAAAEVPPGRTARLRTPPGWPAIIGRPAPQIRTGRTIRA